MSCQNKEKKLDLIIIGAGIAGVNAAVYAKRSGLTFKVFESNFVGGQLFYMERIDNYIGVPLGAKGRDLANQLSETLSGLGVALEKEKVNEVKPQNNQFRVFTKNNKYQAKAIIIATGSSFKRLGIANEGKFAGSGVSYCAVCDGFFFKGKDVSVVGGGNTALEEALYLSDIAKSVTLIHRRDKLRALEYLQKEFKAKQNSNIIYNHVIEELKGDQRLKKLTLKDSKEGKTKEIATDGLFVAIGASPNTDIFNGLVSQDKNGFILTDGEMKTSHDKIWACGDCRKRPLRQLITAASEGAIASLEAYKSLRQNYLSV